MGACPFGTKARKLRYTGLTSRRATLEQILTAVTVSNPAELQLAPVQSSANSSVVRRRGIRGLPLWAVLLGVAVLVVSAGFSGIAIDEDTGYALLELLGVVVHSAVHLRWQFTAVVIVLAGVHYVAAAVALRAAAGIPLRLSEATEVQLAAAVANRVTPAGIGGSAVNARYLTRRGLPLPGALGSVAALHVLGGIADFVVLASLVFAGRSLGLLDVGQEFSQISAKLSRVVAPLTSWWSLLLLVPVITVLLLARWRWAVRATTALSGFWIPIKALMRRPAALATLLFASAATTVVMAIAFAMTCAMVPGPDVHVAAGTLVVGYMLGSAAGNAVPTPSSFGATESALVVVLAAAGYPASQAVEIVLIFRIITFWLPALVGLLASRRLRLRGAL